ncbi:hypothetical protein F5141DRAFT_1066689 [Pisolithus sp. B1]|nr:hypothetical protein F5141DRAFT_1066689 [Pisolithus sp. B1]
MTIVNDDGEFPSLTPSYILVFPRSTDRVVESTLSDDGEDEREDSGRWGEHFSFPESDERKRSVIREYKAMFPKLDFSSLKKGYVFDLLLTRDLSGGHVINFNAYAPHTDPLLLTYEGLHEVLSKAIRDASARRTLFLLEMRHASVTIQQGANRGIDTVWRPKKSGVRRDTNGGKDGVTQAVR